MPSVDKHRRTHKNITTPHSRVVTENLDPQAFKCQLSGSCDLDLDLDPMTLI